MDAVWMMHHERIPVFTRQAVTIHGPDEFDRIQGCRRLFVIQLRDPLNLKLKWAGRFPGFNPAHISFSTTASIVSTGSGFAYKAVSSSASFELMQFVKELLSFIAQHKDVYLKNVLGAGGLNQVRLRQEKDALIVDSTNSELLEALKPLSAPASDSPMHVERPPSGTRTAIRLIHPSRLSPEQFFHFWTAIKEHLFDRALFPGLIAQATIPSLCLDGQPVEHQFFLQPGTHGPHIVFHSTRIAGNYLTATVQSGGQLDRTKDVLVEALSSTFPRKSKSWKIRQANEFLRHSRIIAENTSNLESTNLSVQRLQNPLSPSVLGGRALPKSIQEIYQVFVSPQLSNVDVIPMLTANGIEPAVMEAHFGNGFNMLKVLEEMKLPRRILDTLVRRHSRNIDGIVRAARNKIPS